MTRTDIVEHRHAFFTRIVGWTLLGVVLLAALGSLIFLAFGGRYFIVETPSMGTYAPVGTLVVGTPTTYNQVHVGQTLIFTPPGTTETYFHRVVAKTHLGLTTRGDLNPGADPWTLHPADVHARELFHVFGLGWLIKALPILVIGGVFLHLLTRFFVDRYWRFPIQVAGWSFLFSMANFFIRPWFRAVSLSETVIHNRAHASLVATGLLPVQAIAGGGTSAVSAPGQAIHVTTAHVSRGDRFELLVLPHLLWWHWLVLITIILTPFFLCLCYALYARARGWDYYYEITDEVPEDVVVGESKAIVVKNKIAPLYVTLEELLSDAGLPDATTPKTNT